MKAETAGIEDKVDELLVCLDRDVEHIQESLLRLNELRSLVVRRDDASLGRLLESIQAESDGYRKNELERQSLRKELAAALECPIEQMTLSRLETILPGEHKLKVAERKTRLQSLAAELKREHFSTALLLTECARFNNLLLKGIFALGKTGTICYGPDGSAERQGNAAFMNLQF